MLVEEFLVKILRHLTDRPMDGLWFDRLLEAPLVANHSFDKYD